LTARYHSAIETEIRKVKASRDYGSLRKDPENLSSPLYIEISRCKSCGLSHRTGRKCEKCKGYLRDTIINFGDDLELDVLVRAEEHAQKTDLFISLGTTMAVRAQEF
jgi:NAD-dependent SIR2 family protein deacetylase